MLTYDLEKRGKTPLYEYLYQSIKEDILNGKIQTGEKLPSKRELSAYLGVSVITVVNAYGQLEAEGYIKAEEKKGYFAAAVASRGKEIEKNRIFADADNSARQSDSQSHGNDFPFPLWAKLMRRVITDRYEDLMLPAPYNGVRTLREELSRQLYRARGLEADPENIVVGAGTEYLYNLIIQLFGRKITVAVENPGHGKISKIYSANGIEQKFITVDSDGLRTEELFKSGAELLHFSPSHHYPTGAVTPAGKRGEILRWAEEGNRYIIEDDYDSEFRLSGKPVETLTGMDRSERVIYINTFSKSISPSIRISYMVLPSRLSKLYREKLGFYSCTVPVFEQYTLAAFIAGGYFERHINRMKTFCRKQRDKLPELIENCGLTNKCVITGKDSGLHFILMINTAASDKEISEAAKRAGLKISFVSEYLHAPAPGYVSAPIYEHMLIADYFRIDESSFRSFAEILDRVASAKNRI